MSRRSPLESSRVRSWLATALRGALAVSLLTTGPILTACESPRDRRVELNAEEQRLVRELVDLLRVRIERTRDPAQADSMLSALPPLYDDQEREALLDRLSQDTPRGAAVLAAVHDSLEALRDRIFPPGTRKVTSGVESRSSGRRTTP